MKVSWSSVVYAVAPETIGTFFVGSYESSYGNTSADLVVYSQTIQFFPRQHVSALESDSLFDVIPESTSLILLRLEWDSPTFLIDLTGAIDRQDGRPPWKCLAPACELRPPIIEPGYEDEVGPDAGGGGDTGGGFDGGGGKGGDVEAWLMWYVLFPIGG